MTGGNGSRFRHDNTRRDIIEVAPDKTDEKFVSTGVADFKISIWNRRKQLLYTNGSACTTRQNNPTPEGVVNGTECYDD